MAKKNNRSSTKDGSFANLVQLFGGYLYKLRIIIVLFKKKKKKVMKVPKKSIPSVDVLPTIVAFNCEAAHLVIILHTIVELTV